MYFRGLTCSRRSLQRVWGGRSSQRFLRVPERDLRTLGIPMTCLKVSAASFGVPAASLGFPTSSLGGFRRWNITGKIKALALLSKEVIIEERELSFRKHVCIQFY